MLTLSPTVLTSLLLILLLKLKVYYVKSARIWSFAVPYFPAFGLNAERYSVSLRMQSECRKSGR